MSTSAVDSRKALITGSCGLVGYAASRRLLAQGAEVVRFCKSIGLTVHGTFTSGLPGETKEQMAETLRFIQSLPFDTFQHSGTAEIEGTPLHTLREKGALASYAGARIDDNYNRHFDGNKKFQQMAKELAESVA